MPEDVKKGQAAVDALVEIRAAIGVVPDHRPRYDVPRVVGALVPLIAMMAADLEGVLVEPLKAPLAGRLREAVGRLPVASEALSFAFNEDARGDRPGQPGYHALVREGIEHQRAGLSMLQTLEGIGLVSATRAAQIRSGRGHVDVAGDGQVLAGLGKAHWGVLEGLQALQPDESMRVSQERFERMIVVGSEIIRVDKSGRDTPAVDWRRTLIDMAAILERDWDFARDVAGLVYRLAGRKADSDALVSLLALSRP